MSANPDPSVLDVGPAPSEVVSQSEIEKLLAQVGGGDPSIPTADPQALLNAHGGRGVPRYEFPKLSLFSPAELRPLRLRHEDFISVLASRLSLQFGLEIKLEMSKFDVQPMQKFADGLANPTYLALITLPPLVGTCLLEIPPRLGLCMIDRELGGPGQSVEEDRPIGKIEARLLAPVVRVIANEWCSVWKDLAEMQPSVIGSESNSRNLHSAPPETGMLVVGIQTTLSGPAEQMQMAFPHSMLEPLAARMNAAAATAEKKDGRKSVLKWGAAFDSVEVELKAQLPEISVAAREITRLKPGDVLKLPPEWMNQIRLSLGDRPAYLGTLGVSGPCRAVRISRVLKS